MIPRKQSFPTILVGASPECMAVLLSAHNNGRLRQLLQQSLLVAERRHVINSYSTGLTFPAPLREAPETAVLRINTEPAVRCAVAGHCPLPMADVGDMRGLDAMRPGIEGCPQIQVLTGCDAGCAESLRGGRWRLAVRDASGQVRQFGTSHLILATGAAGPHQRLQRKLLVGAPATHRWEHQQSGEVLARGGLLKVSDRLRVKLDPKVSIFGGATSGIALACELLQRLSYVRFRARVALSLRFGLSETPAKSFVVCGLLSLAFTTSAQQASSVQTAHLPQTAYADKGTEDAKVANTVRRPLLPPVAPVLTLSTTVSVKAKEEAAPSAISTVEFTGKDVLQSAGTWSDLPRYLQTLPGLIGGSDTQNASFVRGGNSFENLFTLDRIEVPNINQLALANSTGGLGSMLDTELIGSVAFHSGDISSNTESRLSSLTEIRTAEPPDDNVTTLDLGYSGGGFRVHRLIGRNKTLLLSARESVTNIFFKDVGLNGSPEFTNSLAKYTVDLSPQDHLWIDSLSGRDRLKVRPDLKDPWETNAFNTDYSGWRNTTGFVWQHTLRSEAVSTWLLSNTQSHQDVQQQNQDESALLVYDAARHVKSDVPFRVQQNNREGTTELKYEYQYADEHGSGSDLGVDLHQNRLHYDTQQTGGIYSPYSTSTTPLPAFSLAPDFSTLDKSGFMDVNQSVKGRIFFRSGVRLQSRGFRSMTGSRYAFLPHVSISVLATQKLNVRFSYNKAAQLPPYATLATAPGNLSLGLIRSAQTIGGASVPLSSYLFLNVEAYSKTYTGYPVSIDYPQLSLATIAPAINEPFHALSMQSTGFGTSRGVEISLNQSPVHHLFTRTNLTFARARFTGADGVYRPGTNDFPFVLNAMAGLHIRQYTLTARNTTTSGRPYTPVLLRASSDQNRMIFDLAQLNAARGPLYNRLDVALNREVMLSGHTLRIHVGAMNLLNRANLYEYLWEPRCGCGPRAAPYMGFLPDLNLSYTF